MDWLLALQTLPDGFQDAAECLAALDSGFVSGFARLDASHEAALASVNRIFRGTPLQDALESSVSALLRNEFLERHFAVFAAARAALRGACYDALLRQCADALGRPQPPSAPPVAPESPSPAVWLESARQWLMELALTGFAKLDTGAILPFLRTLEQIQAEPQLLRLSAILTGFIDELLNFVPVADAAAVPVTRWTDLWTQAMIAALAAPPSPAPSPVSGTLALLGMDIHRQAHLISLTAHGVLTHDGQTRSVRATLSSYKVDAIIGNETWLLFPDAAALFEGLAKNQPLDITDMPLLPTGDLIWNGQAALGKKFDVMKQAEDWFAPGAQNAPSGMPFPPADRHPAQLAEPIFLKDYAVKEEKGEISLDFGAAGQLPVALQRLSDFSDITPKEIAASAQMVGLLRFDRQRWEIQPLGVLSQAGKKTSLVVSGEGAAAVMKKPPKTSTIAILKERSSRLLRGQ